MSGASLTTKGLSGSFNAETSSAETSAAPPIQPLEFDVNVSHNEVMIVVPTAANVVLLAAENITDNLRVRQPASLVLPSLYKRAYMVAYETDEIAVVRAR